MRKKSTSIVSINETKKIARKVIYKQIKAEGKTDYTVISKEIRKTVGNYLFKQTEKKPMVLPMVMKV